MTKDCLTPRPRVWYTDKSVKSGLSIDAKRIQRLLYYSLQDRGLYKKYTDNQFAVQKMLQERKKNGKLELTTFGLKESHEFWSKLTTARSKSFREQEQERWDRLQLLVAGRGFGKNRAISEYHRKKLKNSC